MTYSVFFHPAAKRELSRLLPADQRRVLAEITSLTDNPRPRGCAKLAGFRNVWRIRVGAYRVVYRIGNAELIVEIIRIAHRREVYRGL
jgi:mRNA interferase RelE/StbE